MKKIFAAFIAGALIVSAVPVLAAETDSTSADRPAYCQQNGCPRFASGNNNADNNGSYCNGPHHGRHCSNTSAQ